MKTLRLNNSFSFLTVISFSLMLFTSCIFDGGDPGPQGPPGPAGRDGNANIISISYNITDPDWGANLNPGEDGHYLFLDFDVPEITTDIVESGLVLMYFRATTNDPWIALPFTHISHNPSYTEVFDFIYDTGFISLRSIATDKEATPYEGTVRLLIASAVPVGKTSIDYSDYEQVKEYFGLKD